MTVDNSILFLSKYQKKKYYVYVRATRSMGKCHHSLFYFTVDYALEFLI